MSVNDCRGSGPRCRATAVPHAPAWARRRRPAPSPACGIPDSSVDSSTLLPVTVRSGQGAPTPKPTEHCAPVTSPGSVTEMSACWIRLFQDGGTTFQKNTDGATRVARPSIRRISCRRRCCPGRGHRGWCSGSRRRGCRNRGTCRDRRSWPPGTARRPSTASGTTRVHRRAFTDVISGTCRTKGWF